ERSGAPIQRILAVFAGVMLLRILLRHGARHGAGGPASAMRDRRRAMIAKLHRELHAADAADEVTA
ncbi:MAG TPA: hypothetical protein VHQ42_04470, partial [Candidatus Limnocylindria bacterium]|nr:hypothetical protein [Candidatus Limnocylindria bacterium]